MKTKTEQHQETPTDPVNELLSRIKNSNELLAAAMQRLEEQKAAVRQLAGLDQTVADLEKRMSDSEKKVPQEISALKSQVDHLEGQMKTLSGTNEPVLSAGLEQAIESLREQMKQLELAHKSLFNELRLTSLRSKELDNRLGRLEEEISSGAFVQDLEDRIAKQQKWIAFLRILALGLATWFLLWELIF